MPLDRSCLGFLGDTASPWPLQIDGGNMPDISAALDLLDSTFFLYPSAEAAEAGEQFGGSGVIIGVPLPGRPDILVRYAVTNWHVACKGGASVIRLNKRDGGIHVVEKDPAEWTFIASGPDLAATPLSVPSGAVGTMVPTTMFALPDDAGAAFIGDDVFMVGRFIDFDGHETNKPALRFGAISMIEAPVRQPTSYEGRSYIVDMHSRSGFSGSPVYVYRPGGIMQLPFKLTNTDLPKLTGPKPSHRTWGMGNNTEVRLLGVQWGQFPEEWEIRGEAETAAPEASLIREGAYVRGFSGMSCVVPASDILLVLNAPKLVEQRKALANDRAFLNRFPVPE